MLDQAKAPDTGSGPYTVETNAEDGFHYVMRDGQPFGNGWALAKGAYRKCRELNGEHALAIVNVSVLGPLPTPRTRASRDTPGKLEAETKAAAAELSAALTASAEREDEEYGTALAEAMDLDRGDAFPGGEAPELEPTEDELEIAAGDITRFPSEARHGWLEDAGAFGLKLLGDLTELEVHRKVRVSIGWPTGRKAIGECWHVESSGDGHREIFVSPALEDGVQIVGVLIHELIHACLPKEAKHGPQFGRPARAVGLIGKLTATTPGPELEETIRVWVAERGPYPAKAMDRHTLQKKQTTRLLKVSCCNEHEEYVVRMSNAQYQRAAPVCGICGEDMKLNGGEE